MAVDSIVDGLTDRCKSALTKLLEDEGLGELSTASSAVREMLQEIGAETLQAVMDLAAERRRKVAPEPCCEGAHHVFVHARNVHPVSLFGPIRIPVRTMRCTACRAYSRPDHEPLGVPRRGRYADDVRELLAPLCAELPDRTAADLLHRTCGVEISPRGVQGVIRTAADDVRARREAEEVFGDRRVAAALAAGEELGIEISMDGVMAHVDRSWREAKVGTVVVRRVDSDSDRAPDERLGEVVARRYTSVLGGPEELGERIVALIREAGWEEIPVIEILGDGAPWIWNLADRHWPEARHTLDWWHLAEHFHAFARTRYSTPGRGARWVERTMGKLLEDRVGDVLGGLRRMRTKSASERAALDDLIRYVDNNRTRIRYADPWVCGFAIGSGSVEGACKHLVQSRFKRAGMRWSRSGFANVLELRVARLNGTLDGFHRRARAAA